MADAPASVAREGDAVVFRGALDRAAVPAVWARAQPLLAGAKCFDLTAVATVDSAGLALLAELAGRVPGAALHGEPAGLADLRAAYRLNPALGFAA